MVGKTGRGVGVCVTPVGGGSNDDHGDGERVRGTSSAENGCICGSVRVR